MYCERYNGKVEDSIWLIDKREVAPDSIKANGENIKLIIDKLYTLRAIISFISREIDKCYSTEHKLSPKKKAIQAAEIYKYFYTSYLSMFKDLINENDWENIDLFIYFLETESISTLKDSIEQVNLYSHTGNIENVSFCASKFICNKIKNESNKIEMQ